MYVYLVFVKYNLLYVSPVHQSQANNTLSFSEYFFCHSRLSKLSKIKALTSKWLSSWINFPVTLWTMKLHSNTAGPSAGLHRQHFLCCVRVSALMNTMCVVGSSPGSNICHISHLYAHPVRLFSSSITANKIYIPPWDRVALHLMNPGMRLWGSLLYHHMDQQRHASINYSSESLWGE